MSTDVLMVRVYLSEGDQGRRTNLMREILSALHDKHAVKGVTVFRGVAGFGADGEVHADDMLRLNVDLPLVIEFFDEPPAAEAAIHLLETMVTQGHIVSWPAKRHGAAVPASELELSSRVADQIMVRVPRTWRACSEVARALCRLRVFLCRVRAALDPAPAPVLGMAAAAAAPGGGLLCAEAGGGASARTKATPIEAKIALRIVISHSCLPATTAPSCPIPFIRSSSGPAH